MANHLPDHYNQHLDVLWDKTKSRLPADMQTDDYRELIFKPQRWLNDALSHHGFSEEFALGVQVGMQDWLVNLANNGSDAPMTTFEYAKRFMLGVLQEQANTAPEVKGAAFSAGAELLGTAVVLNENMKIDENRCFLFDATTTTSHSESLVDEGAFLGLGWHVGHHDKRGTNMGLYWLDNGDTCWEDEVEAIPLDKIKEIPTWENFLLNAKRTTVQDMRQRIATGDNSDPSATGPQSMP